MRNMLYQDVHYWLVLNLAETASLARRSNHIMAEAYSV